jgi:CubicO group peptidase (beta-lactamase class C family)
MNAGFRGHSKPGYKHETLAGTPQAGPERKDQTMTVRTTAIIIATGALLCAGTVFAQPESQGGPYGQGSPQGYNQQGPAQGHHHGVKSIISDEIRAGRLSEKEGAVLMQRFRQMHAEKRAERQARTNSEGAPPPR